MDNKQPWYSKVDIPEDILIKHLGTEVFDLLLVDHTTNKNILWGTNDYIRQAQKIAQRNLFWDEKAFCETSEITMTCISGIFKGLIKPRIKKSVEIKRSRSKAKAEVFTPSWVCNKQNNLIDDQWFGYPNPFNAPNSKKGDPHGITTRTRHTTEDGKVAFPIGKSWQDYIMVNRLEMTCGEAPYLVNRYDTDSQIKVVMLRAPKIRIGLLDRKMRIICENTSTVEEWMEYTLEAYKHIYGFEWQGDNLLLARKNLLLSLFDYFEYQFGRDIEPPSEFVKQVAYIISWNIWQMDGLTYQVPYTKKQKFSHITADNNKFCKIMDWDENEIIYFASLINKTKA